MGVLKFLAGKSDNYHHSILIRLSEHSRTTGLELLSSSSDYDQTQQRFFKSLSLLCTIGSFSSEELIRRPRSETTPNYIRSRFDSTSVRVLRTLTSAGTAAARRFEPPADEIEYIFGALWDSLEQWFDIIKDEIHRVPKAGKSSAVKLDSDLIEEGTGVTEEGTAVIEEGTGDCQSIDTRLIASQLVRSKPVDVSVRPHSISSLESIRMSQPAVEFNLSRQCGEHGRNRGLYRDLSRRLYESLNQNHSDLVHQDSEFTEENSSDSYQDSPSPDNSFQSPVYRNALYSGDSDSLSLTHSANGQRESENVFSYNHTSSAGLESAMGGLPVDAADHSADLGGEYLMSYAADHSGEREVSGETDNTVGASSSVEGGVQRNQDESRETEQSQMPNHLTSYPLVARSISYTYAIGENSTQDSSIPADRMQPLSLSQSFSRSLSVERNSLESSQSSTKESEANNRGGKESMVEKFGDRLCAVVHGYHMVSYSRPYWESSR